ncbi:sensor histidine kinase [Winogradskyella sp.]|uniref:tetratricopeptide repeat-containing sensor histidine kinase n=1 Tax=Winogradskyella sp. TaxID=1883156 RepID=UPI0026366CB6|nr:sensor histidine kinase [Winogradskyella sp.]
MNKIYSLTKTLILSASFLLADFCYSQDTDFDNVYRAFEINEHQNIENALSEIDTSKINDYDKATWLYFNSKLEFSRDNHHLAHNSILISERLFEGLNKTNDVIDCIILRIAIISHQDALKDHRLTAIKKLESLAIKQKNINALRAAYRNIASSFMDLEDGEQSIRFFRKTIPLALELKDTVRVGYAYANIAIVHNIIENNLDSALYYNLKAEKILKYHNDLQSLAYNYNNRADIFKKIGDYDNAILFYKKADSIPFTKNSVKSKVLFYQHLADTYRKKSDFKNQAFYLSKFIKLQHSINDKEQNIAINESIEKYNNEKLRADNLESEAKRKQNRNLLFGAIGLLLFGGITFYLIQKNTKRKQKLAEQEKALESQKLATVLKEQELVTIDAMIEGQEKERQRIANDLHDDLGGLMATVKLHFNALKDKESPELFDKTNALIEEAYQKVRSVAHAKNSGVIAKQGLLKAVKNMADKVSASNKLNIEVTDHGLDQRLENSLELTLFRMIQELITNVVKHAEATEATIHLTNHEDSINIMVEDNGKGFNPSQITKTKKGMGISSIDKRVEHLDGKLTIESENNKGTTIIIDIPI